MKWYYLEGVVVEMLQRRDGVRHERRSPTWRDEEEGPVSAEGGGEVREGRVRYCLSTYIRRGELLHQSQQEYEEHGPHQLLNISTATIIF